MRKMAVSLLLCGAAAAMLAARPGAAQQVHHGYVPQGAPKCVEIGNFYFRRKDYRGALSRYLEAVRTDPSYAPGYLGLGQVYEKTGRKRKALEAYRKYLDVLPSEKQADEATDVHKAIERLEQELKRSPQKPARAKQ
jgi:tetratricopeptide (TPR) repeat protein